MRLLSFLLCVLILSSCSGGGDDSGGSGNGGGGSSASTGVRLLHGAIDVPPAYITTSDGKALKQVRFAQNAKYGALSVGEQSITLQSSGEGAESFTFPISVVKGERRSALLYGTRETLGVRAAVLNDTPPSLGSGTAAIRIVHALAGAASIRGSIGGASIPDAIGFGSGSSYVVTSAGDVSITLQRSADGRVVANRTATLSAGKAYTFFLTGEIDYATFGELLEDR